ncbi:MAG: SdrD B-like domain-containing protein, partial [Verrucomicrobiota bacterium]
TLTYTAGAHGSITGTTPQTVNYGGSGNSVTAVPATGYHFVNWDDGSTANPRTDANVTAMISVTANFAINTYTVTASAGSNGSITPSGAMTVNYGAGQTFTITPSTGYHVADVLVDGASVGAVTSYPFSNVTANHTIAASFAINTYTVTASAGSNGSITPSGAITVNYGASQTFTIAPSTGYHVADVSVDGVSVGAVPTYTFNNVTANHTIAASFAINTYTLTYTASLNGSITGTTPQTVNYGGSGSPVTAVPATGYHFVNWDDGSTANPRTDANVTATISVTANFAINTYTLTASAGSNGSITPSGAVTVNYGASQTFTITPSTGYYVADVLVDGASVGAVTSYPFSNVTANHTIAASFAINTSLAINTYTLTYTAGAHGSITGTTPQTVNYGASGSPVTAVPATGYHFVNWGDGSTANPRTDANVRATISVTANFAINTYTLTYTAGAHGSITGTTPQTVNYGGSGNSVTAVPATGYHFVNWGDGSTANPRTDANVTATISVTANFAINTYTLTYTAGAHGSITGTTPQTVNYGGSGSPVTAVPATGYHFVNWGDGSTANPRADANVRATISVTANFAINTCTVTASAGSNGSITPSGAITVNYGASQTFTITANTGYHVADVSVDGLSVGAVTSYTFSNVTAKHTIAASFAINLCALGDFVWSDVKGNGIQDAGEPGIQGVTVKLFKCGDKQATATPAAIATTDASGKYSFLNLMPGSYFIVFVNPDGNKYSGFTTRSAPGSTPANDSNAYADGHTDCVTLAPGATDSTIDAGLIPKRGITIVKTASKTQVAPGEAVTYTYVVANTGGVTLTGLTIVDDNGTPTVTRDDITVGSVASLDPGKSVSLTRTLVPAVTICDNNGGGCGLLITEHLSNGTTRFTFLQSRNGRDNYQTFSGWLGTRSYAHCAKIRVYDKSGLTYQDLDGTPGPGDVSGYFNSFSVVTSTASVVMKDGTSVNMPNICYKKGWNNDWHNDWDRAGNRAHFWDDDYVGHILDWDFNAHPSTCSGKVTNIAKVTASGGSVTVTATDDATVKIVK